MLIVGLKSLLLSKVRKYLKDLELSLTYLIV